MRNSSDNGKNHAYNDGNGKSITNLQKRVKVISISTQLAILKRNNEKKESQ